MAITTKTDTYFDDLNVQYADGSHLDKNYLRVLFKPGVNVQTRELNQAQSILQAQIDRLGSGLFKPNSQVVGGQVTLDSTIGCIEFSITDNTQITESLLTQFQEDLTLLKITRQTSDSTAAISKATVTAIESVTNSTAPGSPGATHRIYYKNTEGTPIENVISTSEALTLLYGDVITDSYTLTPIDYKKAIGLTADAGIYFVRGSMVAAQRQYAARPLDTDSDNFNGFAYFLVEERYVSSNGGESYDDSTLNDNAFDTSNFLESGADRYQIVLTLKLLTAAELSIAANAVKLADIRSNEIYIQYNGIDQSGATLEDTLARRTYEESGNYTVKNFELELKELFGSDYNALYTSSNDVLDFTGISSTDASKYFAAKLSPGVAYVKGKRVETLAPTNLVIPKATKTYTDLTFERKGQRTTYNAATTAIYGNYVVGYTAGLSGSGLPSFENDSISYNLLDLYDQVIGTTKILGIEPEGEEATGQIRARVYLHSIVLNSGKRFSDVVEILGADINNFGIFNFVVEKLNGIALNDINNNDSIFEFSNQAITDVKNLVVSRRLSLTQTLTSANNVVTFEPTSSLRSLDASRNNVIVAKNEQIITSGYYIIPASNGAISIIFDANQTIGTVISVIVTETGDIESSLGTKLKTTELVGLTAVEGDIYSLNNVYHAISVTDTNNWILVDDGQRDNSYVNAKVRRIGNASTSDDIEVTHWDFITTGTNYYTVNSYKVGNITTLTQAPLDEIPTYGDIALSDAVDCRTFPGSLRLSLDPYSAITADIDFYLPRLDLICVNSDNSLVVINGQSDLEPKLPNIPDDGMAIYALYVPQFTANATDVDVRFIENRRYTMSDIGNIEKRIGAIEYYTSLSLLERDANDRSIFGTDGEKFKNGFITDGFRNLDVSDSSQPEFLCSIDSARGILYPYHTGYSIPFNPNAISNGITIKNNKAFLSYTETDVDYLTQLSASQFIDLQPHEQSADVGIMNLTPEVDTWSEKSEQAQTTVELYDGFDSVLRDFANEAGFTGTQWNSWVTTSKVSKKVKNKKAALKFLEANGATGVDIGKFSNKFGGLFGGLFGKKKKRITIQNQVASGIQTDLAFEDVEQSLGDYVKDVKISTYMRTRPVLVDVAGVKPNTQFYAFFDGKDVTQFVKLLPDAFDPATYNLTADEGKSQAELLAKYSTTPQLELKSDDDGNIVAMFIIPNDANFKFSTGEKLLRLTNSPRNINDEEDSFAEARFISNGLDIDSAETVISTQVPRVKRQEVKRNRICVRKNDPIAQTFRIQDDSGIFASSIELAFAQKPPVGSAQVQVYLVTVANGYPTDFIVPGSETSLKNSEIVVSDDSSAMTRFEFDNPIYLEPNVEYAVVAFSGSYGYKAYIADLGAPDITNAGDIISEQPAVGVFFTSANKTTWSASQNRDLKFKINRANFNATSGTLAVNPVIGSGLHRVDISSFNDVIGAPFENIGWETSAVVTVSVTAAPAGGRNAVVSPVFNSINTAIVGFNITEPGTGYTSDPVITVTQTNQTTGTIVRSATFAGKRPQYRIGAFNLNQKFIELSGKTQISNILELDTGANARTYSVESGEPIEDLVNSNFAIGTDTTADVRLSTRLTTTDNRISPVIDLESLSLETREYAIRESGATSRYFSKPVYLADPADQLDVIIDINLPTTTSNVKVYGQFFDENSNAIDNKYFTRKSPNSGVRFSGVDVGWRLVANNTQDVVAIIIDIQQVDGVWRYYYAEKTAINTATPYDLVPASGTSGKVDVDSNSIALPVSVETDWIELTPASPKIIPVNSDRAKYSEVKFNVNPPVDFKQFAVKIEFRGKDYIDVPTIRNFRAIATL
jgi:hypothetical protein